MNVNILYLYKDEISVFVLCSLVIKSSMNMLGTVYGWDLSKHNLFYCLESYVLDSVAKCRIL